MCDADTPPLLPFGLQVSALPSFPFLGAHENVVQGPLTRNIPLPLSPPVRNTTPACPIGPQQQELCEGWPPTALNGQPSPSPLFPFFVEVRVELPPPPQGPPRRCARTRLFRTARGPFPPPPPPVLIFRHHLNPSSFFLITPAEIHTLVLVPRGAPARTFSHTGLASSDGPLLLWLGRKKPPAPGFSAVLLGNERSFLSLSTDPPPEANTAAEPFRPFPWRGHRDLPLLSAPADPDFFFSVGGAGGPRNTPRFFNRRQAASSLPFSGDDRNPFPSSHERLDRSLDPPLRHCSSPPFLLPVTQEARQPEGHSRRTFLFPPSPTNMRRIDDRWPTLFLRLLRGASAEARAPLWMRPSPEARPPTCIGIAGSFERPKIPTDPTSPKLRKHHPFSPPPSSAALTNSPLASRRWPR